MSLGYLWTNKVNLYNSVYDTNFFSTVFGSSWYVVQTCVLHKNHSLLIWPSKTAFFLVEMSERLGTSCRVRTRLMTSYDVRWFAYLVRRFRSNRPFYRYGGHIELGGMSTFRCTRLVLEIWSFRLSLYIAGEKGDHYYIQRRHNDLFLIVILF